ncbi:hypothetical protein IE53DRAFT_387264 [Violaceomyces palustris]|uniref:Uncharacterized protein n=1 Tax=Violaceomyces palustris TaxID=1673888 RepID=A0ACD0NX72_9BASI|nr:hypothetical protein IE53DRAFT_387264 [Violaceomyces palustris]
MSNRKPGNGKAQVHTLGHSIRANSKTKQRQATHAATTFGSTNNRGGSSSSSSSSYNASGGGSLASSLSSLLQPSPHGKDAGLAALLAANAKSPYDLTKPKSQRSHARQQNPSSLSSSFTAAFDSFGTVQDSQSTPPTSGIKAGGAGTGADKALTKPPELKPSSLQKASANPTDGATASSATATPPPTSFPSSLDRSSQDAAKALLSRDHLTKSSRPAEENPKVNSLAKPLTLTSSTPTPTPTPPPVPLQPLPPGRKAVYRPVLSSSLNVNWPEVSSNLHSQTILHCFLDLFKLEEVDARLRRGGNLSKRLSSRGQREDGKERNERRREAKRRKSSHPSEDLQQRRHPSNRYSEAVVRTDRDDGGKGEDDEDGVEDGEGRPWILSGINSVTRAMEETIQSKLNPPEGTMVEGERPGSKVKRKRVNKEEGEAKLGGLKMVFVCSRDVDPPRLVSHFPMLTCSYNAICHPPAPTKSRLSKPSRDDRGEKATKTPGDGHAQEEEEEEEEEGLELIPLPVGSEELLGKALRLKRCSVLALTEHFPERHLKSLRRAIQNSLSGGVGESATFKSIYRLRSEWLEVATRSIRESRCGESGELVAKVEWRGGSEPGLASKVKVKHVKSTAPTDPGSSKARKKERRERRKASKRESKMGGVDRGGGNEGDGEKEGGGGKKAADVASIGLKKGEEEGAKGTRSSTKGKLERAKRRKERSKLRKKEGSCGVKASPSVKQLGNAIVASNGKVESNGPSTHRQHSDSS